MFRAFRNLYNLTFARTIVLALRAHDNSLRGYLSWFWQSRNYRVVWKLRSLDRPLVALLLATMLSQIAAGVWLLADWARNGTVGEWAFGLALLVSYPLVIALLFAFGMSAHRIVYYICRPRLLAERVVAAVLAGQVRKLRRKHHFVVVAVTGTINSNETKLAIAQLLGQSLRVRYEAARCDDVLRVPLLFFNQKRPRLWNLAAWMKLFGENTATAEHPYPYDVVVVELGLDTPGNMLQFSYLRPDISVLTAITPERMTHFESVDALAAEVMPIFDYSKRVLVNGDYTAAQYLVGHQFEEYSTTTNIAHNYFAQSTPGPKLAGQVLGLEFPSNMLEAHTSLVGEAGAHWAVAAAAVADMLGMDRVVIRQNIAAIAAGPGRGQVVSGREHSTILDTTFDATPSTVMVALDTICGTKAPQRIAILGSLTGLGSYARDAHRRVGAYCDQQKIEMVVTIGADARRWLAPAAREAGCQVHSFANSQQAGEFVHRHLKENAVVLAAGSSTMFVEEALKPLLAHPADQVKLVRQGKTWLRLKAKRFKNATL